jgi:hypothetical protein
VRHRVMGPIGPVSLEPAIRRALSERDTTKQERVEGVVR